MLAGILDGHREPARGRRLVTRRRVVLAGIPALATAAAAAFVVAPGTPSGSAHGQLSAASVRTAILDALRRDSEFDYRDGEPYQDVESTYIQTADMDSPVLKTTQGPRSAKVLGVNYQSRTWATFTTSTVPVAMNASPALIRSEITSGNFAVDGTVRLNGREAVKITWVDKTTDPFPTHVTLWVIPAGFTRASQLPGFYRIGG